MRRLKIGSFSCYTTTGHKMMIPQGPMCVAMTHMDRPRLTTIVSQASSVHVPLNADDYNHYVKNHIHATYSFPSSQRTSRTITTTNSTITFEMEEEEEEEEDVNVAFEYIADDEEAAAAQSAPPTIEAIEAIYMSRGMDVLMR
eukprot:31359_1